MNKVKYRICCLNDIGADVISYYEFEKIIQRKEIKFAKTERDICYADSVERLCQDIVREDTLWQIQ